MKERAPRNRTLSCDEQEIARLSKSLKQLTEPVSAKDLEGVVINQDLFEAAAFLPRSFADLIVIDPPYNITKNFNGHLFRQKDRVEYRSWFESVLDIPTTGFTRKLEMRFRDDPPVPIDLTP